MTEVRLRHLSPIATDALRRHTRIQQAQRTVIVGRTVTRFPGQGLADVDSLLDGVITLEIPYAGANSASVKRLRHIRQAVRALVAGDDVQTSVQVQVLDERPTGAPQHGRDREGLIDILAEFWDHSRMKQGDGRVMALGRHLERLAGEEVYWHADGEARRAWLSQNL